MTPRKIVCRLGTWLLHLQALHLGNLVLGRWTMDTFAERENSAAEHRMGGEDFLVHRFQRCGCTKALLRLAVMSPLHRSELLVCIECG